MGSNFIDTHPSVDNESMEEILSSIRKIMSTDLDDIHPPKTRKIEQEDVLELTRRVDLKVAPSPSFPPSAAADNRRENLISAETLSASVSALSQLNQAIHAGNDHAAGKTSKHEAMEEFIGVLLRPLLKEWLDRNLPSIVESIVQKEIQTLKKNL